MGELNEENLGRLRSLIDAFEGGDDTAAPQIFSLIDRNSNGRLETEELRTVMSQVAGEKLTESDISEMIEEADSNKNGVIELNEFIDVLKKNRDS